MPRNHLLLPSLALGLLAMLLAPGLLRADDQPSPTEARMREALRNTMLQLRDAQNQMIGLQAAQQQDDKDKADLQAKVTDLTGRLKTATDQGVADKIAADKTVADLKQAGQDLVTEMVNTLSIQINLLNKAGTDDKETLDKSIADLVSKNPDSAPVLTQYGKDIELWKTGYYEYVQFANRTEAARAKLAAANILLQRVVQDRETKNLTLYQTASEILNRYEKFSLGEALSAKEPFIGLSRVKLQEQVQDYQDKLQSQKLSIGQPVAGPVSAPGSSKPPAVAKGTAP